MVFYKSILVRVRQGGQGGKVDKEEENCSRIILLQILHIRLKRPFFVCIISLVYCPSFLPCLVSTQMLKTYPCQPVSPLTGNGFLQKHSDEGADLGDKGGKWTRKRGIV
jgi:hypothetical protein